MARGLLYVTPMRSMPRTGSDMMTLARLHAALDSVHETASLLAQIRETASIPPHGLMRATELVGEARELLRALLARPEPRQGVEKARSG
jgi:hypothetical protein